ncbi:transcriptional regulator [Rhodococcus erythropolis]|uniref:transcriptional regulator n=1 Tax=Rhodococcus erythropolis TaxID=1833 RepID=UPI00294A12B5|nr:transcriptional regulator [Rhodococcus erythropolis]MDV6278467.1 transcriptional regulator [Rhodococcus erythropolis]
MSADSDLPRHPLLGLDDVVHQKTRLAILTLLGDGIEVDFSFLRSTLGLTDGNLGRHLEILATAGYIAVRKSYNGRRVLSWVRITESGRLALAAEANALRALLHPFTAPLTPGGEQHPD